MQLILKTDADIGIGSNMSVLKQDSFSLKKKIANNDVTGKFKNDIPSVTEVNAITNNKENSTDNDILENDGSLVNGKVDETLIEISAHSESDQELSVKSKVLSNKDEEVDEVDDSINSNHENENNTNLKDNLKTSDNLNEEKRDMKIKDDKEENICDEIDLDNSEIIEREPNETRESNLLNENKTGQNITLETASENVSCKEPDSSSNKYDSKQPEIHKIVDAETTHESEQPTERRDEKCKSDKQDVTELEFTMRVKNVSEINEKVTNEKCQNTKSESSKAESISLNNTEKRTDSPVENEVESNNDKIFELVTETDVESNQNSSHCAKNDEVIDIGDDKDDECVTVEHDKDSNVEKEAEETQKMSTSEISTSNENNDKSTKEETHIDNEHNKNNDISKLEQDEQILDNEIIKDKVKETSSSTCTTKEKKRLLHISKLSNTLDILSDDDEEEQVPEAVPEIKESDDKQCISIEDDDDIMLIDEESPNDDNKTLLPPESDMPQNEETKDQTTANDNDVTMDVDKSSEELTQKTKVSDDEKVKETGEELKDEQSHEKIEETEEKSSSPKPLLPVNFLKSCKKNFSEMTREELEEFCVLKIVESVVDRSNLSEMNLQLKAMAQNIEDYKKKTNTLLKQNRDLQVVLKSIQEEQKKNSGQPITPLKITRSVGMQVFMIESQMARKRTVPGSKFPTNSPNAAKLKSQSPKTPKVPNNLQIPVPRLVPANNNTGANNKQASPVANKAQGVPNGVKSSPPTTKPEKRSFNKMQQGNSITVDLTDDEPPSKVAPRNVAPPVRLVPQQSLLTSQRPQFLNTVNIPRKVYIPISGSQNPVSPGHTIMLKQVAPHVPRLRGPGAQKSSSSVRMPRIAPKHPAPLPDSMKQYQPPNWKALPPPPELKLSKVENGIVISWKIDGYQEENHEEIASYQLYAYQETSSPPSTSLWKKIGDVKALPLPMACTLTQFMAGYKYYFAVRAVDVRSRLGPFSLPGNILLLNKM